MTFDGIFERRTLLKATAAVGSLLPFSSMAAAAAASPAPDKAGDLITTSAVRMVDVPLAPTTKVTVERRGQIVLIGINRPDVQNRIDPETYLGLARAYYRYDHDPSLRAAVLFGHGDNFSRGIDVVGFQPLITAGKPFLSDDEAIDPLAIAKAPRSKPLIAVVHGDTWNSLMNSIWPPTSESPRPIRASGRKKTRTVAFPLAARQFDLSARQARAMPCVIC